MSLWDKYKDNQTFEKLNQNIETDTLIIGGGITGLTTLYYLKENPFICLVDASRIGEGVTKNTTGKLTFLQEAIYTDLEKNIDRTTAINYLHSQQYAISLIQDIITKEHISCDLEKVKSFLFTNKEKERSKLENEKNFLKEQNIEVKEEFLPFEVPYKKTISVENTFVFNPIKYINGLKKIVKDKKIYENTKIIKIEEKNKKYICHTSDFIITAKKVIVTCHYPFFNLPFLLPLKSHIEKSYLIATKTNEYKKCSCINLESPSISMRYYKDGNQIYKIALSKSHNTAFNQDDQKNFKELEKMFHKDKSNIEAKWSNVDIMTDDKLPYIGKVKNELFLATGFNTWGMTNSILAAKILSEEVNGSKNKYSDLFQIHRHNKYKCKSFLKNTTTSLIAMIGSKFIHKKWYSSNLKFTKKNGKTVAIYTDEKKIKHKVYTTCPHFGCSLIFNETEKTWDCPCHSSRFDIDGNCIKGPSLYDISYKK